MKYFKLIIDLTAWCRNEHHGFSKNCILNKINELDSNINHMKMFNNDSFYINAVNLGVDVKKDISNIIKTEGFDEAIKMRF